MRNCRKIQLSKAPKREPVANFSLPELQNAELSQISAFQSSKTWNCRKIQPSKAPKRGTVAKSNFPELQNVELSQNPTKNNQGQAPEQPGTARSRPEQAGAAQDSPEQAGAVRSSSRTARLP